MAKLKKINISAAVIAALMLSTASFSHAGFEEAVKAYEAGDYDTALNEWMVLAEKDDPAAMRNIGHIYRLGLGREVNYERAMHWYKRASALNFPNAQANVASMYLRGQGVAQDYVEASKWFTKAARNGHVISQYNLGLMYENGKGVEKSLSKALAWYNLAAKAGHPKALDKLSLLVATKPDVKVAKEEENLKVVTTTEKPAEVKSAPAPQKVESAPAPKEEPKSTKVETQKTETVGVEPKAGKPAVSTPAVTATAAPASAPVTKTAEKPKFDPFAGSANNKALKSEQTGAPTAFNQEPAPAPAPEKSVAAAPQKQVQTESPPAKVVSEPKRIVSEASAATSEKPALPEPKTVDTTALQNPEKAELKSLPQPELKPAPATEQSTVAAPAETTSAPVATAPITQPTEDSQSTAENTDDGQSKGFFGSLKALVFGEGEDKSQEDTPEPSSTVAVAPTPAIERPKAAAPKPVEVVVPADGLTIDEKLEMAQLSFEVEQYQQALNIWAPLAQQGNVTAQYNLGRMFNEGYAVPVDRVKAYYWWQKAKSNGSELAATSLEQLETTLTFIEKERLKQLN
ncbi:SEL1-like repeat protein [Sneathiella limimaris]|uniref:SEL1-like repeat protein n=1 Tax=Sneathiella limimaris TaxID=1964213 RepID=UPI00146AF377|nr:SEL1-like repeat protein [Sneathiella limimaris]